MHQIVISLLGLSVYDTKSNYKNNSSYDLKSGEFINSIDVLLNSFNNRERFIFFGTEESIDKHKEVFKDLISNKDVTFIEYDSQNLNDIFYKIISTIIDNKENEILFDITHSFRDSVIMSVISTIVSQIVYNPNITMIYAKQEKENYVYELVGDDILNTSNIAFILSSFISTLRLPPLSSKYELFEILNNFSIHLMSNQFKSIYETDIVNIKKFIQNNEEKLFFVKDLLEELENIVLNIEATKNKDTYAQFLFFAKFFFEKDYYLHSATYLIEAITYYIGYVLTELKMIDFNYHEYDNQTKIVGFLRATPSQKDFKFPNEYFIDINIDIINKFYGLREKVAKIRHNLAHININQDYSEVKEKLDNLIKDFSNLINEKILYKFDITEEKKKYTVKYALELYEHELNNLIINNQNPAKLQTVIKKFEEEKLDDLTMFEREKLKKFINTNYIKISELLQLKEDRKLLQQDISVQMIIEELPNF